MPSHDYDAAINAEGVFDCLGFPVRTDDVEAFNAASDWADADVGSRDSENALIAWTMRTRGQENQDRLREQSAGMLRRLMEAGISREERPFVWTSVLHADDVRDEAPNDFGDLIAQGLTETYAESLVQVDKDVGRTFPMHPCFHNPNPEGGVSLLESLRRVLTAMCVYHRHGYCQGLGFLAGFILLVKLPQPVSPQVCLSPEELAKLEEDAFWLIMRVVEDVIPDFFESKLEGTRVEVALMHSVVAACMPHVHGTLEDVGLPVRIFAVEWLATGYTTVLPSETLLRLWDLIVLGGRDVLMHAGVAILSLCAWDIDELVEDSEGVDACEVLKTLRRRAGSLYEGGAVLSCILRLMWGDDTGSDSEKGTVARRIRLQIENMRSYCANLVSIENRRMIRWKALGHRFIGLDSNHDGVVDMKEFRQLYNESVEELQGTGSGSSASGSDDEGGKQSGQSFAILSAVFNSIDRNDDGVISKEEFMQAGEKYPRLLCGLRWGLAARSCSSPRLRMVNLFNQFDKDNSGSLDRDELFSLVSSIYVTVEPLPTGCEAMSLQDLHEAMACPKRVRAWEAEADSIMALADLDGNGVISHYEFSYAAAHMPVLVLGISLLSTAAEKHSRTQVREMGAFRTRVVNSLSHKSSLGWRGLCSSATYTVYEIEVDAEHFAKPVVIERRYNEFLSLHRRVKAILEGPVVPRERRDSQRTSSRRSSSIRQSTSSRHGSINRGSSRRGTATGSLIRGSVRMQFGGGARTSLRGGLLGEDEALLITPAEVSSLLGLPLPPVPPKTNPLSFRRRKNSTTVVNTRRQTLQAYLESLRFVADTRVRATFREWLGLPFKAESRVSFCVEAST